MRGYGDLAISQERGATGPCTLTIQADADVMPRILAEVRGDRLVLGFSMPWYDWIWWGWQWLFTTDKRIRFTLAARGVEELRIAGAGIVTADRLEGERLHLAVSGAGKIRLAGVAVKTLDTRLSGAADVELSGTADRHDAHLSGAGKHPCPRARHRADHGGHQRGRQLRGEREGRAGRPHQRRRQRELRRESPCDAARLGSGQRPEGPLGRPAGRVHTVRSGFAVPSGPQCFPWNLFGPARRPDAAQSYSGPRSDSRRPPSDGGEARRRRAGAHPARRGPALSRARSAGPPTDGSP